MTTTIQVDGLAEAERQIGTALGLERLRPHFQRETRTVLEPMASAARSRIPRRSGRLAGSVSTAPTKTGTRVSLGWDIPYAGWIEFGGTRGREYVRTGRYFFPSFTNTATRAKDAYERALDATIKEYPWR